MNDAVIAARRRSHLIDHLRLVASPIALSAYQRDAPAVNVFGEIFNTWEDFEEAAVGVPSLERFQGVLYDVSGATPDQMGLEDFITSAEYTRLRHAAVRALAELDEGKET